MKARVRLNEMERKNSHSFFEHRKCEYFPCHPDLKGPFNCLFCFCPLYAFPCEEFGTPRFIEREQGATKDCSGCLFPHRPESYVTVLRFLAERERNKGQKGT